MKPLFASLFLFLGASPLFGYALESKFWTLNRTVHVQLSLGAPQPLIDGFASFNESAADALQKWNSHMKSLTFVSHLASPVVPAHGDGQNSAVFANTVFGDDFGEGVLAVTLLSDHLSVISESDTIFNNAYQWNSYSGALRGNLQDFHRVALHEFGHMVGLDHPDEIGQTVVAIMNSVISNVDRLQPDDIAGAEALYPKAQTYSAKDGPILANISTRGEVEGGDKGLIGGFIVQGEQVTVILRALGPSLIAQGLTGALPDPVLTLYDENGVRMARIDNWVDDADAIIFADYHLDPPASTEPALLETLSPGAYTAVITSHSDSHITAGTGTALFELYDLHTTDGRAGNLSTRGQVLAGDGALIGGFIIGGVDPKPIVVRALGPSLAARVPGYLPNPRLELHDSDGNLIESNDDWAKGPDANMIRAEGLAPKKAKESALQTTLSPGQYTIIVRGVKDVRGSTGIGLVEVYDISDVP
ncbi:MAG TPA: matrixin family metalloprotease [Chthoniobacterales bacterium]